MAFSEAFKVWTLKVCQVIKSLLISTEMEWELTTSQWWIWRLSSGSQSEAGFQTRQMCLISLVTLHFLKYILRNWECCGEELLKPLWNRRRFAARSVFQDIWWFQTNDIRSVVIVYFTNVLRGGHCVVVSVLDFKSYCNPRAYQGGVEFPPTP